jgi:biofilm PGA synthesis N-glycosyltransferase PgaC
MEIIEYLFSNKRTIYVLGYSVIIFLLATFILMKPTDTINTNSLRFIVTIMAAPQIIKYFLYMIISPWHDVYLKSLDNKAPRRKKTFHPKASVIIPGRNEEVGILNTIKTLLKNTYKYFEIVIINDGSTDNSDALIRTFIQQYKASGAYAKRKIDIQYKYVENGGKGRALNTGIQMATGEIIITIDADCVVDKNAIKNIVNYFRNPQVMGAVANVKIGNTISFWGILQYLEFIFSFYLKKADSLLNTIYIIGGAGGAFRKKVFEQLGYYNHKNITEDIDLSVRLQEAGMKIIYAQNAIIYTEGANSAEGLIKQRLRWKRGKLETFRDHKNMFFSVRRKHNKLLTWVIFPLSLFGDFQLSIDIIFLGLLYITSYLNNDFSAFISGLLLVTFMFLVIFHLEEKKINKPAVYFLAPIGWLLFYVTTIIEINALIKSVWGFVTKKKLKWQYWERTGLQISTHLPE